MQIDLKNAINGQMARGAIPLPTSIAQFPQLSDDEEVCATNPALPFAHRKAPPVPGSEVDDGGKTAPEDSAPDACGSGQVETSDLVSQCYSVEETESADANGGNESIALSAISISDWIKADQNNESLADGNDSSFDLPIIFRNPVTAQTAWAGWYGSPKAATRASEAVMRLRSPETARIRSMNRSQPGFVLTIAFSSKHLARTLLQRMDAKDRDAADPLRRLTGHMHALLGDQIREVDRFVSQAPAVEVAREVEKAWPFMRAMHDNGAYSAYPCKALLALALMRERFESGEKLTSSDRTRALLVVNFLLRGLPPRLAALVGIHSKVFNDAVGHTYKFFGVTCENFNPDVSIWDQIGSEATQSTVAYLTCAANHDSSCDFSDTLARIRLLEPRMVMEAGMPRTLAALYADFCANEAGPRYEKLVAAFERYSVALEVTLDNRALPRNLVGRDLVFKSAPSVTAIHAALKRLCELEPQAMDVTAFLDDAEARMARINQVHSRITELSQTASVSVMLKIADLAKEAKEEILSNRDWFSANLALLGRYIAVWDDFYAEVEALSLEVSARISKEKPRQDRQELQAPVLAPVMPETEAVKQLTELLEASKTDLAHTVAELRESRCELHRLRQAADVLGAMPQKDNHPVVNADLIRRVTMRDNLHPAEVLAYFEFVGEDRVEILESAWRSVAEYTRKFSSIERMIDLIDKLVFPYLDAMNSGTPDTQARGIFGGSKTYSAKESDTTRCDARLRAMREFTYQGEKLFFERHLRVSNLTGAEGMRVHFDIINGRAVIAYCGPHLDVGSTN